MQFFNRSRNDFLWSPTEKVGYTHTSDPSGQSASRVVYGGQDGICRQGSERSISDTMHPGYKRLRARGDVVLGDLLISKYERSNVREGDLTFGQGWGNPLSLWGHERVTGDMAAWVEGRLTNPLTVQNDCIMAADRALVEAYAKMKETPLMAGEFLSDLDKTVSMLRHPVSGARNVAAKMLLHRNKLLKRKVQTAKEVQKANAQAWLEGRYGWTPLVLDMREAVKQVHKLLKVVEGRRRLVARGGQRFTGEISKTETIAGGMPRFNEALCSTLFSMEGRVDAGVIYEVFNRTTVDRLMAILGLRLWDVPATIYEIIPFSFVWDWFTNTGKWIQAVTPNPGIDIRGNWVTTVVTTDIEFSMKARASLGPSGPYPLTWWEGDGGGSHLKWVTVSREINRDLTSTPEFTMNLSLLKAIDGIALGIGQVMTLLGRLRH